MRKELTEELLFLADEYSDDQKFKNIDEMRDWLIDIIYEQEPFVYTTTAKEWLDKEEDFDFFEHLEYLRENYDFTPKNWIQVANSYNERILLEHLFDLSNEELEEMRSKIAMSQLEK